MCSLKLKRDQTQISPYWHATDRRSNQIYSTSCFAFIYFYLFIIIPCVATKLLFIPPYEILIDFFRAVIYLKKNRRGCGDFSCDEFPKLSKYVIKLPFHFPFAAKGTVLSRAGRRCSARRRASQAASLTKQQHNMLYVKKERAEWDRQTLSHDLEGGATICLSNPESFPYFYCSTRFNIMT